MTTALHALAAAGIWLLAVVVWAMGCLIVTATRQAIREYREEQGN